MGIVPAVIALALLPLVPYFIAMRFYSAEAMRGVDARAMDEGTPGVALMGRAALGLAEEIAFLTDERATPAIVLAGPGNNGGDGFGLAFHLHRLGGPVEIWGAVPRERVKGDAAHYLRMAEEEGVRVRWLPNEEDWDGAERFLMPGALLVDALLGTGTEDAPRKTIARAVRFLLRYRSRHRIIAIDIPTGLDADRGGAFNPDCCVQADFTLTLGGAKKGFLEDDSAGWTGSVSVVDLGIPSSILEKQADSNWLTMGLRQARKLVPARPPETHKGSRGHVLLIGGSPGMTGAISLAARSALRAGSGLATVLTPHMCATAVDVSAPELMVVGGRVGSYGSLNNQPIPLKGVNGVLLGPGLRADYDTRDLTERVNLEIQLPLVLDADALQNVAGCPDWFTGAKFPRYLTPHPGEMARLVGGRAQEVQQDRVGALERAHRGCGYDIVLKGSRSRMVTSAGRRWLNLNGNPGMATGGAGDVLAGMVVSLAAQGVYSELVLPLAVFLHGKAGDLALMRRGESGMIAGDVVDAIPAVMRRVQGR